MVISLMKRVSSKGTTVLGAYQATFSLPGRLEPIKLLEA